VNDLNDDLVVLVADQEMGVAVSGLLSLQHKVGCHAIKCKVFVHPQHDPGCLRRGHEFLRPMCRLYSHSLIMFDREGCGQERRSREELESVVTGNLSRSGWDDRGAAIVLDPELEVWAWGEFAATSACFGWRNRQPDLRTWLVSKNLWPENMAKPPNPKFAMEIALREVRKPRSSSIFIELAEKIDFSLCRDPAFRKLLSTLQSWFPPDSTASS